MHRHDYFLVAERRGYRAIRLAYSGERVSMVVMLPAVGIGAGEVIGRLDGRELHELLAALRAPTREVELVCRISRKLRARAWSAIPADGHAAGIRSANSKFRRHDRSRRREPLAISQIEHRAVIEVTKRDRSRGGHRHGDGHYFGAAAAGRIQNRPAVRLRHRR